MISMLGSFLNAKKSILCFYVWIFANIMWITYDISIELYSRMCLDILQTIICIYGIKTWKLIEKDKEENLT